ncbi:MAG: antirestriction protein ArdA [Sulfurovum sp.]|nr:antirestriction protein ArdA [Sulfurovum sp.]
MLQIYLTDLECYNNGHLVGDWVKLPMDKDDLAFTVKMILGKGEKLCNDNFHEEYLITDFEFFTIPVFNIEEYDNIYTLNNKTLLLEELKEYELKIVKFLLDNGICSTIEDALEETDNVIVYEDMSMAEVAEIIIEESYDLDALPSIISSHINYESIARDLEYEGFYHSIDLDVFYYPY